MDTQKSKDGRLLPSTALFGIDGGSKGTKRLWEIRASNWVLREVHDNGCTCSYCKEGKVGLVLPGNKARNSWRSIRWKLRGNLHVLRWTLPKWWPNADCPGSGEAD